MLRPALFFGIGAAVLAAGEPGAQPYPLKPLRIITAEAGGGSDVATRLIAAPLGVALGQQVIVDNRGLLAAEIAARTAMGL